MANWVDKLFVCVGIPSMVIYIGLSAYSLIRASSTDDKRRDAVIRQAANYREMRKQQDGERIDNRRVSS